MRGENWPIANWTTTMVIVRTRAASDTIDAAMVWRMAVAASGSPVNHRGIASKLNARSTPRVAMESTTPATTHMTGTNHRPERSRENRDEELIRSSRTRRPEPSSATRSLGALPATSRNDARRSGPSDIALLAALPPGCARRRVDAGDRHGGDAHRTQEIRTGSSALSRVDQ
jgi:hypothetical protein